MISDICFVLSTPWIIKSTKRVFEKKQNQKYLSIINSYKKHYPWIVKNAAKQVLISSVWSKKRNTKGWPRILWGLRTKNLWGARNQQKRPRILKGPRPKQPISRTQVSGLMRIQNPLEMTQDSLAILGPGAYCKNTEPNTRKYL